MNENRQFLKNSFLTFTRQVMNILFGVMLLIVLARYLGPKGQGQYSLITLFPGVLLMLFTLGINTSTIYYVSKKEVTIQTVYTNNMVIGLALGLISMVLGAIIVFFYSGQFFSHTPDGLLYVCLLTLPFLFLREYFLTVFQGLQDFKAYNTMMVVNQLAILAFVGLLVILLKLKLPGAIFAFLCGNIVTAIVMVGWLKKKYQLRLVLSTFSADYFRKSVNYGLKAYISNFSSFLNYRLVVFLIGFLLADQAVGIYVIAMNIAERLAIFAASFSSVLYPKIASFDTEEERNRLTSIVSRNMMAVSIGLTIVGLCVPTEWIVLLFGGKYTESATLLRILLPGIALLSVEKILSNDIAGRGKPELNMYLSVFNVLLNVLLNVWLIPLIGLKGAALSATLTYAVSFAIKVIIFKQVAGEPIARFLLINRADFRIYKRLISKLTIL
ncbi:flippase [Fictibacillus gelatini]|uniref:flippase n=1 Tax=Fictibacillus gelatini TaxID=225985 RepID=UPI00041D18A3|nr:flippase [Fictibacillus gelatini]